MARRPVVLVASATVLVGLVPATAIADDRPAGDPPTPGRPGSATRTSRSTATAATTSPTTTWT